MLEYWDVGPKAPDAEMRRLGDRNALLQEQAAAFGVNRDAGKAGEEAIAKQAGFTGEDGVHMEAGGDIGECVRPDYNGCLGLGDGKL